MGRYQASIWIWALPWLLVAPAGAVSQEEATERVPSQPYGRPATVSEAVKVVDLREFPQLPGGKPRSRPGLATLSYQAPGNVADAYKFIQSKLVAQKWHELPGGYHTERSANGTFARLGYKLSVSVSPARDGDSAGQVDVRMMNHGNVDTAKLPTPKGTKPLYEMPTVSMFVTEATVAEATGAVRKLLLADGWKPYGDAGDTHIFRQNAVQLSATVASAPAQQGKTMINYSTSLMSLEIPLPPDADRAQYTDSPPQLSFDVKGTFDQVSKFYRQQLAEFGWKATSEELIKIGFRHFIIFRNEQKDLLQLRLTKVDDKTRGLVQYSTAAEVAEMEKKAEAESKRRQAEANRAKPKLVVRLPDGSKNIDAKANEIEFTVDIGKAKDVVVGLQKQLTEDGWKAEDVMLESMFGNVELKKGGLSLSLTYVETGVLAPEITIGSFGVDLEMAK